MEGAADIIWTTDPGEFAERAGDFLAARAERNVAATVLQSVLHGRYAASDRCFAYALDEHRQVRLAVLRTPPWPLLVCDLEPAHAPALIELWLRHDPDLPGASGMPESVAAVVSAWRERTGGQTRCRLRSALHALEHVIDPPPPAPGDLRLPSADERDLLIEWNRAFEHEANVAVSDRPDALVDERLANRGWVIWDDRGPVSLIGVNPMVAGAVRLGPVYTPPAARNRGYASTAVAAASRRALAEGASRCLLYTDLANPTSNKIYAQVGYVRCADWEEHAFQAAGPAAGNQPPAGTS